MRSLTFSRIYAASIVGLGVIGLAIACGDTEPPPPTVIDMAVQVDLTPLPADLTTFNPPRVTSVSPTSAVNNVPTAITVTGSDFRPGAQVTVAGAICNNVTVQSPTSLTCTTSVKAATCGPQDIVVTHPDDGKVGTGTKLFTLRSTGPVGWAAPMNYPTGTTPRRVLVADLNADGKLDIVTVNQGSSNITVKMGLGDGTFPIAASQNLTLGAGAGAPQEAASGDFDGDGKPDLAIVNSNSTVTVMKNQGATFMPTVVSTPTLISGYTIAVGDVTADTKPDIVIGSSTTSSVLPLLNSGTGTFTAGTIRTVGGFIGDLTLADMNADTKLDLVTANASTNNVTVCLSTGVGTFGLPLNHNSGTSSRGVFVTDLDGDKKLDVVVANSVGMNVSVLMGDNTGMLQPTVNQALTSTPDAVWVGDVSGDGKPDILTANGASNNWSYLIGVMPKQYTAQPNTLTGAGAADITVADVNADGLPDVIIPSSGTGNVQVSLGLCK